MPSRSTLRRSTLRTPDISNLIELRPNSRSCFCTGVSLGSGLAGERTEMLPRSVKGECYAECAHVFRPISDGASSPSPVEERKWSMVPSPRFGMRLIVVVPPLSRSV